MPIRKINILMILEADVFCATEGSNHKTVNKQLQSWKIAQSSATRQGNASPTGSKRAKKYGFKSETFDFLGFTHFCDKTRKGKFKLGRKTSRKKFTQKMKDMNLWLKHIRNLKLAFKWINNHSQQKSYTWNKFQNFIRFNPLHKPKIYHSLYNLKT